jgi:Glycosyltransferase family 9 (heptosyltransferase)
LAVLGSIPSIRLYSLQKGEAGQQARQPPAEMTIVDWTDLLHDFADTAALIANLDLVISVDTSVAHLAGAMGKPVWTMLCFAPDWRYHLDRDHCPWYPTMRLFRQRATAAWRSVAETVAECLLARRI